MAGGARRRSLIIPGLEDRDDQTLETDVMRFMAIIGIVFWMVFALVKTLPTWNEERAQVLPPDHETAKTLQLKKDDLSPAPPQPLPPSADLAKTAPPEALPPLLPETGHNKIGGTPVPEKSTAASPPGPPPDKKAAAGQRGLSIGFQSVEDLKALISEGMVEVYVNARSPSFDLNFRAVVADGGFSFESTRALPSSLWRIVGGRYYQAFLDILKNDLPVTRTFPTRQVFIHFNDTGLEGRVEEMFASLSSRQSYGVLRIDRRCNIVFAEGEQ